MEKAVMRGMQSIAGFGLATGISNKASAPHVIANSFKNIMALSLGTEVEIKQAKGLKASAAVAEVKKEEKKAAPKKEEKKKVVVKEDSSDDDMGMGLF